MWWHPCGGVILVSSSLWLSSSLWCRHPCGVILVVESSLWSCHSCGCRHPCGGVILVVSSLWWRHPCPWQFALPEPELPEDLCAERVTQTHKSMRTITTDTSAATTRCSTGQIRRMISNKTMQTFFEILLLLQLGLGHPTAVCLCVRAMDHWQT